VQKIAAVLADKSDLDVIHMVSHGSAGAIRLGTSSLSASTLERYHSELTTIGQALTAEGDLLLYGCDVGRGSEGARFLSALAAATGADVAASINPTGNSALGGDWALEVASGSIESGGLAPLGALGVYTGLLDDDYSGDPYTTGTVAVGSSVTGDIETAGDRDWFAVTLTAGTTYRIDLAGDATGQGTLQDPYFWGSEQQRRSARSRDE
jgi:fibronectin-binding autotransporter adhesin